MLWHRGGSPQPDRGTDPARSMSKPLTEFDNLELRERLKLPREEAERHLSNATAMTSLAALPARHPRGVASRARPLVNLERTTFDEACTTVSDLIRSQSRFSTSITDAASVERFVVSSRIRAALAQNPPTAHLDLDVEIEDHTAVLRGKVRSVEEFDLLRRFVFPIPGDIKVDVNQVQLGSWDYQPPLFFEWNRRSARTEALQVPGTTLFTPGVGSRGSFRNGSPGLCGLVSHGTLVPPS